MSAPHKNDIFGISTSRRIDWYIKIDIFRWEEGGKGSPAQIIDKAKIEKSDQKRQ